MDPEVKMLELRTKRDWLPWAITALALAACVACVLYLWSRDDQRARAAHYESRYHHEAMLRYIAQADSIAAERMAPDTVYERQMLEFWEAVASLDGFARAADARQDEIAHAPVDSLPAIIRRIIADARQRGVVGRRR